MKFRLFGYSNWKIQITQGKGGRWRWSIWDRQHNIKCLANVSGHESAELAEAAAYDFLDGVGAPKLGVESIIHSNFA